MIDEHVKEDIDFLILEDILSEPHCEVKHEKPSIQPWCPTCSHKVVAKLYHRCNGKSGLVCEMVVLNIQDVPRGMKLICASCGARVAECWEFQPI